MSALLVAGLIVTPFAGQSLATLATTTAVLPDDTYFTDLTPRQRHLAMNGRSGAAARGLREPAFLAPMTCSDTGRADLFSIRAELTP
ncbi:MAG: hypothetical protein ACRYG8_38870 [Janthinobacterium lividum]